MENAANPTFDPIGTVYSIGKDLTVSKTSGPKTFDIGKIDYVLFSHDQHHDNFDNNGRVSLKVQFVAEGLRLLKSGGN